MNSNLDNSGARRIALHLSAFLHQILFWRFDAIGNACGKKTVLSERYRLLTTLLLLVVIPAHGQTEGPLRILHVPSYHMEWKWNKDQLDGFKAALKGLDVEIRIVELDTKRHSDEASIREKAHQAFQLVETWKPDLIYANDDNAQRHVAMKYVGADIPIVFSGVNRDPSEYDYIGADNVTGVLEHEHIVPTLTLLKRLRPKVKTLAIIVDADPTWKGVMSRIHTAIRHVPSMDVVDWAMVRTRREFEEKMGDLQGRVDAIGMLGVFNIKDEAGEDIDYEEILRWTVEHSQVPDFSFWQTGVDHGTLCAVTISGYEQGYLAGTKARQILAEGIAPARIPIEPIRKGQPMVSLARARRLGMQPDVGVLLESKVVADFYWER